MSIGRAMQQDVDILGLRDALRELEEDNGEKRKRAYDRIGYLLNDERVVRALCNSSGPQFLTWFNIIDELAISSQEEVDKFKLTCDRVKAGNITRNMVKTPVFCVFHKICHLFLTRSEERDDRSLGVVLKWWNKLFKSLINSHDQLYLKYFSSYSIEIVKALASWLIPNQSMTNVAYRILSLVTHLPQYIKLNKDIITDIALVIIEYIISQQSANNNLQRIYAAITPIIHDEMQKSSIHKDYRVIRMINLLMSRYSCHCRFSMCQIADNLIAKLYPMILQDAKAIKNAHKEVNIFVSYLLCLHHPTLRIQDVIISDDWLRWLGKIYMKVFSSLAQNVRSYSTNKFLGCDNSMDTETVDLMCRAMICVFSLPEKVRHKLHLENESIQHGPTQAKRARLSTLQGENDSGIPMDWETFFQWFGDSYSISSLVHWHRIVHHVLINFVPNIPNQDYSYIVHVIWSKLSYTKSAEVAKTLLPLLTLVIPKLSQLHNTQFALTNSQWSELCDLCIQYIMVASLQDLSCELLACMLYWDMVDDVCMHRIQYALMQCLAQCHLFRAGPCRLLVAFLNNVDFDESLTLHGAQSHPEYSLRSCLLDYILGLYNAHEPAMGQQTWGIASLRLPPDHKMFTGPPDETVEGDVTVRMLCECALMLTLERPHLFHSTVLSIYQPISPNRFQCSHLLDHWSLIADSQICGKIERKQTKGTNKFIPEVVEMLTQRLADIFRISGDTVETDTVVWCMALCNNWCFLWGLLCHFVNTNSQLQSHMQILRRLENEVGGMFKRKMGDLGKSRMENGEVWQAKIMRIMVEFSTNVLSSSPNGAQPSRSLCELIVGIAADRNKSPALLNTPEKENACKEHTLPDTMQLRMGSQYNTAVPVSPHIIHDHKLTEFEGHNPLYKLRTRSVSWLLLHENYLSGDIVDLGDLDRYLHVDSNYAHSVFHVFIGMQTMSQTLFNRLWNIAKSQLSCVNNLEQDCEKLTAALEKLVLLASHTQFPSIKDEFLEQLTNNLTFVSDSSCSHNNYHIYHKLCHVLLNESCVNCESVRLDYDEQMVSMKQIVCKVVGEANLSTACILSQHMLKLNFTEIELQEMLNNATRVIKVEPATSLQKDESYAMQIIFIRICQVFCQSSNKCLANLATVTLMQAILTGKITTDLTRNMFLGNQRMMRALVYANWHRIIELAAQGNITLELVPAEMMSFPPINQSNECLREKISLLPRRSFISKCRSSYMRRTLGTWDLKKWYKTYVVTNSKYVNLFMDYEMHMHHIQRYEHFEKNYLRGRKERYFLPVQLILWCAPHIAPLFQSNLEKLSEECQMSVQSLEQLAYANIILHDKWRLYNKFSQIPVTKVPQILTAMLRFKDFDTEELETLQKEIVDLFGMQTINQCFLAQPKIFTEFLVHIRVHLLQVAFCLEACDIYSFVLKQWIIVADLPANLLDLLVHEICHVFATLFHKAAGDKIHNCVSSLILNYVKLVEAMIFDGMNSPELMIRLLSVPLMLPRAIINCDLTPIYCLIDSLFDQSSNWLNLPILHNAYSQFLTLCDRQIQLRKRILNSLQKELNWLLDGDAMKMEGDFITESYLDYLRVNWPDFPVVNSVQWQSTIGKFMSLMCGVERDRPFLREQMSRLCAVWAMEDIEGLRRACHYSVLPNLSLNEVVMHLLHQSYFDKTAEVCWMSCFVLERLIVEGHVDLSSKYEYLRHVHCEQVLNANCGAVELVDDTWTAINQCSSNEWITAVLLHIATHLQDPLMQTHVIHAVQSERRAELLPYFVEEYILEDPKRLQELAGKLNNVLKNLADFMLEKGNILTLLTRVLVYLTNSTEIAMARSFRSNKLKKRVSLMEELNLDYVKMCELCLQQNLTYESIYFAYLAADCKRSKEMNGGQVVWSCKNPLDALDDEILSSSIRNSLQKVSLQLDDHNLLLGLGPQALSHLSSTIYLANLSQNWEKLLSVEMKNGDNAQPNLVTMMNMGVDISHIHTHNTQTPQQLHDTWAVQAKCTWMLGQWNGRSTPKKIRGDFDQNLTACLKMASMENNDFVQKIMNSTWEKLSPSLFIGDSKVLNPDSIEKSKKLVTFEKLNHFKIKNDWKSLVDASHTESSDLDVIRVTRSFMQSLCCGANSGASMGNSVPRSDILKSINRLIESECRHEKASVRLCTRLAEEWQRQCSTLVAVSKSLQLAPALIYCSMMPQDRDEQLAIHKLQSIIKQLEVDCSLDCVELLCRASIQYAELQTQIGGVDQKTCDILTKAVVNIEEANINNIGVHNNEQVGETMANAFYKLALYNDHIYSAIHQYANSHEFTCKKMLIDSLGRTSRATQIKYHNISTAPDMKTALCGASREAKAMEEEEKDIVKKTQREQMFYVEQCIKDYIKCMTITNKHDHIVFRLVSLILDNRHQHNLITNIWDGLCRVPTYKWVQVWPQIVSFVSKITPKATPFDKFISKLIINVAQEHPRHTIYNLICLADLFNNSDFIPATQDPVANIRMEGAREIVKCKLNCCASVVRDMRNLAQAYDALAKRTTTSERCETLSSMCPQLMNIRNNQSAILTAPCAVDPSAQYDSVVTVAHYVDKVMLLSGKNKAIAVQCVGSDGLKYRQVVKGDDDVRQDALMEQVFDVTNCALRQQNVHMQLNTYNVVALSPKTGVLQWCDGTITLGSYLNGTDKNTHGGPKNGAHYRYRNNDHAKYRDKQIFHAISVYQKRHNYDRKECGIEFQKICDNFPPVFRYFFYEKFSDPVLWRTRTVAYTKSVALSSIVGCILGLGDRHVENIMINTDTGEIVHIDLGIAFDQGRSLPIPELVPFRLTRDIIDPMGVTGVQGTFTQTCHISLHALRKCMNTILCIVSVLLHDPLAKWTLGHNAMLETENKKGESARKNTYSERTINRIKDKLEGRVNAHNVYSVQQQVTHLIMQATDIHNLATIFAGWRPYC